MHHGKTLLYKYYFGIFWTLNCETRVSYSNVFDLRNWVSSLGLKPKDGQCWNEKVALSI